MSIRNIIRGGAFGVAAAVAVAATLWASHAEAAIIIGTTAVTNNGNGTTTYTYTAMTDNTVVASGDYFAILDFAGYKTNSAILPNSDWTLTTPNTVSPVVTYPNSQSMTLTLSGDNSAVPDLLLTYNGPDTGTGLAENLGNFSFVSNVGPAVQGTAIGVQNQTIPTTLSFNGVSVPQSTGTPPSVPLPAALWPAAAVMAVLAIGMKIGKRQLRV